MSTEDFYCQMYVIKLVKLNISLMSKYYDETNITKNATCRWLR